MGRPISKLKSLRDGARLWGRDAPHDSRRDAGATCADRRLGDGGIYLLGVDAEFAEGLLGALGVEFAFAGEA
jgi:hypothetical protein